MRLAGVNERFCRISASLAIGFCLADIASLPVLAQSADQYQRDMNNDVAATPPQDFPWTDDEPAAPKLPPRPAISGFTTMPYHPDTASVWTTAGHRTLEAAKQQALLGCNSATGGGCIIVAAIKGLGRIPVTEDAMEEFWVNGAVGDEMLTPVDLSLQHCFDNSFGCKFPGSRAAPAVSPL